MLNKFLVAAAFCVCATTGNAAETKMNQENMDPKMKAEMEAWAAASKTGEEHKMLAQMTGKWKITTKSWHTPNGPVEETKGTSTGKAILGGRFIHSDYKGKMMGQPYEGQGVNGFDNVTKTFQSTWIDSMSTGIMMMTGTMDPATKVINQKGQYMDPLTKQMKTMRAETKFTAKNEMTFTMYMNGPDGKEFKSMEMVYTK